jgi:L-rhamnose 1-epimerase
MIRKGIVMKVFSGFHDEYKKRHDELWSEMVEMIHEYGGKNYSIFLDADTNTLFGYLEIEDEAKWSKSAETEICQKWWAYMKDIMETNPDNSPVSIELKEVFHLD